jgi:hypothetical protein
MTPHFMRVLLLGTNQSKTTTNIKGLNMKKFLKIISILLLTSLLAPVAFAKEDPQSYCPTVDAIKQVGVDQVVSENGKWLAVKMKTQYPGAEGYWTLAVFPFKEQSADQILLKANAALPSLILRDVYTGGGHGGAYFICEFITIVDSKVLTAWAVYEGLHGASSLKLSRIIR